MFGELRAYEIEIFLVFEKKDGVQFLILEREVRTFLTPKIQNNRPGYPINFTPSLLKIMISAERG